MSNSIPPTRLVPIPKWEDDHDWPPEGGLRHLAFHSKTNGFARAFKKVGRRILVDERAFYECVEEQNKDVSAMAQMCAPRYGGKECEADINANVMAGQQNRTTSRVKSGLFFLSIDGKLRITADERCWRIEQRKDGDWRPVEYHTTLEAAVYSLSGRLLRTSNVQCLADALAAVEDVARMLTQALEPHLRLEARS